MSTICKNCGAGFEGKYCPVCAQKAGTGRLKVANVLHELWHNFTHTDRSVLGLINALFTKPGVVIREYIEGKRKKYYSPYTFFLLSSGLLIFITKKVFQYEDNLYHYNNEFGQYSSEHYTVIILFSFPVLASILRLIFIKKDINYAEWVTFLIFSYCIVNVVQILFQGLYFPLIKYHSSIRTYTELSVYLILFIVLIKFVQPLNFMNWLQCVLAVFLIFLFIEFISNFIALWLGLGVPLKVLLHNYHVF